MFIDKRGIKNRSFFAYIRMLKCYQIKVLICCVYLKIGQEYPAVVEFAPFQKTAKKRSKKRDTKCGTIIEGDYIFNIKRIHLLFVNLTCSVATITNFYRYSFK